MVVRMMAPAVWEQGPAIVVPNASPPLVFFNTAAPHGARLSPVASISYIVLLLDREVMTGEMLPALTTHHFRDDPENIRYQLAVVEAAGRAPVYRSTPAFSPDASDPG